MQNLHKLLTVLDGANSGKVSKHGRQIYNYVVPDVWNVFGYPVPASRTTPQGELIVDPFDFYATLIRDVILPKAEANLDYGRPLSALEERKPAAGQGGDWIRRATVYSAMVRASSAWDHDRNGKLDDSNLYGLRETGTFVKMLALLPTLTRMGVDTLYLLPISQFSLQDKKGDLGSPYGVSDFFRLDPGLKDSMTGDQMTLEEEFRAFVEACHILGLRVMIDIIPRTNAIHSALITTHPDWFYWIPTTELATYLPPTVPGLGQTLVPKPEFMPAVYGSEAVKAHIRKFVSNPRDQDPKGWEVQVLKAQQKGVPLLEQIRSHYGVTVAPAFSDHINDVQPPWSDVTFFRLYLDHPAHAADLLGEEAESLAPYILFDTIKANLYPGHQPNQPLWDTLASIIPHFQSSFGIDGARIDMGHALPEPLVRLIIERARAVDPDFCCIAEELYPEKAREAKRLGYNMIIGEGFYRLPRVNEYFTHAFYYGGKDLPLPVFAAGETHDTPRLAARDGGRTLSRMISVLNLFMPNGVPFINSGQEVWETQPMNTGLDCREDEAFRLPPSDPAYGKLALFDRVAFHYLNPGRWDMIDTLATASQIRRRFLDALSDPACFVGLNFASMQTPAIGLGYCVSQSNSSTHDILMVVAHTDLHASQTLWVDIAALRQASGNQRREVEVLFSTHVPLGQTEVDEAGNLVLQMAPGEVRILWFRR